MKKLIGLLLLLGSFTFSKTNESLVTEFNNITEKAYAKFSKDGLNQSIRSGAAEQVTKNDAVLNRVYKEIYNSLNTKDKKNLLDSQRSWIKINEKFKESNALIFNPLDFGIMGDMNYSHSISSFSKSRAFFLNTYADGTNNKNTNNNLSTMFNSLNDWSDRDYFFQDKSLEELNSQLNVMYQIVLNNLKTKESFLNKDTFKNASSKIVEAQREWTNYSDLNFKFIDENKTFSAANKLALKKYIYAEIIEHYVILNYYLNLV